MIVKVNNGKVDVYNDKGSKIRIIAGPSNAISADCNSSQNLILITRANGTVDLFDDKGSKKLTINAPVSANNARFNGNDIAVHQRDGKTAIYNRSGSKIKIIP